MPSITDWLMVGITAVYVIATILICIFNANSANAAKEQTEEMRKQFDAVNRPQLYVEIAYTKRVFYSLRIVNSGNQPAIRTVINIDDEFIKSISEPSFRTILEKNKGRYRTIGIGQTFDLFFASNNRATMVNTPPLRGTLEYYGNYGQKYEEAFEINLNDYTEFLSVNSDLDDIKEQLKEHNRVLKSIQQQLAIRNSDDESLT